MKHSLSYLASTFVKFSLTLSAILLSSSLALASEDGHGASDHGTGSHGANKKHIVGVFFGSTKDANGDTDGTIGVEYEFKINSAIGLGAIYEKSPSAHDDDGVSVYLASFNVHPIGGLRLSLGLGQEKLHGSHGHKSGLTRAAAAYDFHVAGFGIAPTIAIDRVDSESIKVFGLAISKQF